MTDLDDRLTDALTRGADDAPSVVGLAAAARSRARRRRRRREWALAVAGSAVVAATVVVLRPTDAPASHVTNASVTDPVITAPPPPGPTGPTPDGTDTTRAVSEDGVTVRVPSDWVPGTQTCADRNGPAYAPPDRTGCRDVRGIRFYPSAMFDPAVGPGLGSEDGQTYGGYRIVGDGVVVVQGLDRTTAQAILDSAVPVDGATVATTWHTESVAAAGTTVAVDVPEGCHVFTGNPTESDPCSVQVGVFKCVCAPNFEGSGGLVIAAGLDVGVHAPDRATALRILGSARPAGTPAPDLTRGFTTQEQGRYVVDVPVGLDAPNGVRLLPGVCDCTNRSDARRVAVGRWRARVSPDGYGNLVVTAPTEALADLIASTARNRR